MSVEWLNKYSQFCKTKIKAGGPSKALSGQAETGEFCNKGPNDTPDVFSHFDVKKSIFLFYSDIFIGFQ